MTSQLGKQTIAINILPNTSRSKSNQTMKLHQLIEYNHTQNVVKKLFPHPLLENKTEPPSEPLTFF